MQKQNMETSRGRSCLYLSALLLCFEMRRYVWIMRGCVFLYPKRGDRVRGCVRDEDDVKTTDEIQWPWLKFWAAALKKKKSAPCCSVVFPQQPFKLRSDSAATGYPHVSYQHQNISIPSRFSRLFKDSRIFKVVIYRVVEVEAWVLVEDLVLSRAVSEPPAHFMVKTYECAWQLHLYGCRISHLKCHVSHLEDFQGGEEGFPFSISEANSCFLVYRLSEQFWSESVWHGWPHFQFSTDAGSKQV